MSQYDYNRHYKIKELCELLDIEYNAKNPKLSLNKIRYELELEQISKQKYRIVRELSESEKAELHHYSQCKQILEPTIYYLLSKSKDYKIRDNMKGYFERLHITNEYYKYFAYENITNKKIEILDNLNFGDDYDIQFINMTMNHFVTDTNPIFRRIVLDTFHKMVDESYIIITEYLMFGVVDIIDVGVNKHGDKIQKTIYRNQQATDDERKLFTTIRREKMEQRNYNEWSKVPFCIKSQIIDEIVIEMNKKYLYYDYEIILNKEGLQRKSEEQNLEELFNQLNISIAEKIRRSKNGGLKNMSPDIKEIGINNLIISKPNLEVDNI